MIKIGLVDVDGHNFPNLALMRISAFHKQQGDNVSWWWSDFEYYDIVYMSKIFSNAYSQEKTDPLNVGQVIRGGTGYAIDTQKQKEIYSKNKDIPLPKEIEKMFPDYSIYPQYDFAVSMTSRGCPRGCPFCLVGAKEGLKAVKVANVSDFYSGQKIIEVLDPNITACKDKHELFNQYLETHAQINFNQGLDIRLLSGEDIEILNKMRLGTIHFAWDNPKDMLEDKFKQFAKEFRRNANLGMVYVLVNFNSTMEENLYRIYKLRDLGYDPFVMIYNKPSASKEIRKLQRWCNNKWVFKSVNNFYDFYKK